MRVLVVEDELRMASVICRSLAKEGFAADVASDGEQGVWMATAVDYDAIVLDLMLPGTDGFEIVRALRAAGKTASVLVLTARDGVADRVTGLDLGADDYLVKPFAFEELAARLRALVRRTYERADPTIRVADLEIDTRKRRVCRAGEPIELSAREYALLEYLASRTGHVVTRAEIYEHVYDAAGEPWSNVLDVYVSHLRRKIDVGRTPKLIHTKRGQGYLLGEEP